mmetsp:Transcript_4115/g.6185  ORF Transcript_4115/g.6185 Transcript_4115/m.6185 type:complete len:243 (-) Transcript_4115:147-875(-)
MLKIPKVQQHLNIRHHLPSGYRKLSHLILPLLNFGVFALSMYHLFRFLYPCGVVRLRDVGLFVPTSSSVDYQQEWRKFGINVGLLFLFVAQHSLFIGPMRRLCQLANWSSIERSVYVLSTCLIIQVIVANWRPVQGTLLWAMADGSYLHLFVIVLYWAAWLLLAIQLYDNRGRTSHPFVVAPTIIFCAQTIVKCSADRLLFTFTMLVYMMCFIRVSKDQVIAAQQKCFQKANDITTTRTNLL